MATVVLVVVIQKASIYPLMSQYSSGSGSSAVIVAQKSAKPIATVSFVSTVPS
jgi:hypothetical protein